MWFRHKLLLVLTFATIAAGTAVVTMLLPNEYESRMKILSRVCARTCQSHTERTCGTTGAVSDNSVTETQINSEIELLASMRIY